MKTKRTTAILPQAEQAIAEMAHAHAARSTGVQKASLRRWMPRVATTGLAVLAMGGTALAATGVWNPIVGNPEGTATTSDTPSPTVLTQQLGILRRPQSDADHSPAVEASLRGYDLPDGLRPSSVRYVGPGAAGEATIVFTGEQSHEFGAEQPVCLIRPWNGFRAVSFCFSAGELESGRAYSTVLENHGQVDEVGLSAGLVPDGVATVTAHFAQAPDVTVPVEDNFWELEQQGAETQGTDAHPEAFVYATTWNDAEGNVIPQKPEG
jgi:hypothetical protein